jgi:hypothetical protein
VIRFALATAPAEEPVTLTEAKAHARIEHSAEDTLVTTLIKTARQACEKMTGRAFITQTWTASFDRWADVDGGQSEDGWPFFVSPTPRRLALSPRPPIAITSLVVDGVTIATSEYALRGHELFVKSGVADSVNELGGGIVATFTAGYGAAAAVPNDVKQAILTLVAHFYENREAANASGIYSQITPYAAALLAPYEALEI